MNGRVYLKSGEKTTSCVHNPKTPRTHLQQLSSCCGHRRGAPTKCNLLMIGKRKVQVIILLIRYEHPRNDDCRSRSNGVSTSAQRIHNSSTVSHSKRDCILPRAHFLSTFEQPASNAGCGGDMIHVLSHHIFFPYCTH